MKRISKTFPGVKALRDVRLSIAAGEVHSLMGENGAGRSTLMKILSGAYQPDAGAEIVIDGRPVVIDGPLAAKALGIAVIYQELSLCPNLSVAENIYLGRELRRHSLVDRKRMESACAGILQRLGATFGPGTAVAQLSIAERQLVEIARALHGQARILAMDEPTTPLSSRETERLFALIRQLRDDGLTIIYISHRMSEIYELSDRVSVLRDGSYVGTLAGNALAAETLVQMMVGRDLSDFYKKAHAPYDPGGAGPCSRSAGWATASGCATAASRSTPAKCSALPASSAPGAPNSPAWSSAPTGAAAARSASTACRSRSESRSMRSAPA